MRTPPAFHAYEMRSDRDRAGPRRVLRHGARRTGAATSCRTRRRWRGRSRIGCGCSGPRTPISPRSTGRSAGPVRRWSDLLDDVTADPPDAELVDEQGVTHRRWSIPADVPIGDWLADEPLLIADGHHRYTTALAYRDEMRATSGPGPWDRLLTFVVDAGSERLSVRPFHRVQLSGDAPEPGRSGSDLDELLAALSDDDLRVGHRPSRGRGRRGADACGTSTGEPPAVRALHDGLLDAVAPPTAAPVHARRRTRRWPPCGAARRSPPTSCRRPRPTGSARSSSAGTAPAEVHVFLAEAANRASILMPLDR